MLLGGSGAYCKLSVKEKPRQEENTEQDVRRARNEGGAKQYQYHLELLSPGLEEARLMLAGYFGSALRRSMYDEMYLVILVSVSFDGLSEGLVCRAASFSTSVSVIFNQRTRRGVWFALAHRTDPTMSCVSNAHLASEIFELLAIHFGLPLAEVLGNNLGKLEG